MPIEVGAVDALEALGDDRADAQEAACPWRPSRARSRCRIPCPAKITSGVFSAMYFHRRVVDRFLLAVLER